jgi:hypothetical protein
VLGQVGWSAVQARARHGKEAGPVPARLRRGCNAVSPSARNTLPTRKPKPNLFPSAASPLALASLPRRRLLLSLVRSPPIDSEPVRLCLSVVNGSGDLVTGAVPLRLSPSPSSAPLCSTDPHLPVSLVRSPLLVGEPVRCAGLPVVDGSVDLVTGALILLSYPYSVTLILDLVTGLRVSSPLVASSVDLVLRRAGINLYTPNPRFRVFFFDYLFLTKSLSLSSLHVKDAGHLVGVVRCEEPETP